MSGEQQVESISLAPAWTANGYVHQHSTVAAPPLLSVSCNGCTQQIVTSKHCGSHTRTSSLPTAWCRGFG